jgi:hypothetical protein
MVHLNEDASRLFHLRSRSRYDDARPCADASVTCGNRCAKHYTTGGATIETLLIDPAAKAIIDKHIPGFSDNPQISMVPGATLLQLQPMKPDVLSDANLAAIDAELACLPAK